MRNDRSGPASHAHAPPAWTMRGGSTARAAAPPRTNRTPLHPRVQVLSAALTLRQMFHRLLPDRPALQEVDAARFEYFKVRLLLVLVDDDR